MIKNHKRYHKKTAVYIDAESKSRIKQTTKDTTIRPLKRTVSRSKLKLNIDIKLKNSVSARWANSIWISSNEHL